MLILLVVRERRLELLRVAPLDPKSSASTNSATLAQENLLINFNDLRRVGIRFFVAVTLDCSGFCSGLKKFTYFAGRLLQIVRAHNVVPIKDCPGLVSRYPHSDLLLDSGSHHISNASTPQVVEKSTLYLSVFASVFP